MLHKTVAYPRGIQHAGEQNSQHIICESLVGTTASEVQIAHINGEIKYLSMFATFKSDWLIFLLFLLGKGYAYVYS